MLVFFALSSLMAVMPSTSVPQVRDTIAGSVVTSSVKLEQSAVSAMPVTSLTMNEVESSGISSPKELSSVIPGLNIPDYGTAMTSTVYVRGIGSRMDNPVIGLYVDDVPIIDKNCYDFAFADIRRLDFLHGPQGTLYGRNSMLGVLSVETLSPESYRGTRMAVEYGSASSLSAKVSTYRGRFGVAAAYGHSDGFFVNEYDGSHCGLSDAFSARVRYAAGVGGVSLDNILTVSYTDQTGYPYRKWIVDEDSQKGSLLPVEYNGRSGYRRLFLMDGLKLRTVWGNWGLSSVTSFQALFDAMDMDQDFTPESMFTLEQNRKMGAFTQEFVAGPERHPAWWDCQTGLFVMLKTDRMSAPVHFLEDGIRSLILDKANAGIPPSVGKLDILEDDFLISSDFDIALGNIAVYHESYFRLGRFLATAGLRIDAEKSSMDYDSGADLHFTVSPIMTGYVPLSTENNGTESLDYVQLQPKFSVLYDIASERMRAAGMTASLSAAVSKGYRSGGFNTQIFSDNLRNGMMYGMMEKLGMLRPGQGQLSGSAMTYKPETCMDYEVGGRFGVNAGGHRLDMSATAYLVDCRNMQMTVFPDGDGTGRMMDNAGRARSCGVEAEALWLWKGLSVSLAGSLTDARFVDYDDGLQDWSGNRIPYSPESALYLRCGYRFLTGGRLLRSVAVNADLSRNGRTFWDESGDLSQAPYSLVGADLCLCFPKAELRMRGQNLADTEYSVFYFKSVGDSFFQTGKPRRFSISLTLNL